MNTQSVVSIFVVLELCMSLTMTNIPPNESYLPRMIGTKAPYLDPTVSTVIPFTYPDSGPGTPTITIPGPYQWADSYGTVTSDPTSQANTKVLNLVTYNILAPINGEGEKHAYAPVSVTKWTRRRDKIVDEIRKLKCDILCLQEMSAKGLKETFIPKLGALGLECCAYAPSKQADRSRGKYAHRQIGNAVFIRSEKLKVLSAKRIHLKDFTPLESCTSHNFVTDVHSRHDSMAMVQVQVKDSNEILIICNAHFYWNPNRADIKAIQAYAAVEAIHRFCIQLGYSSTNDVGIILCGDLNTMPSNQPYAMDTYDKQTLSAPFELFTTGQLSCQHPEHPDKYYMQVRNGIHPKLGPLKSHFKLTNIYSKSEFEIQKPLFTTKTDDFSGWIDHIWVNDIVDVSHVLVPPIRAGDLDANMKARSFAPIPGLFFPSDHLPIGMTVTLKGLSNE